MESVIEETREFERARSVTFAAIVIVVVALYALLVYVLFQNTIVVAENTKWFAASALGGIGALKLHFARLLLAPHLSWTFWPFMALGAFALVGVVVFGIGL